MRNVVAVNRWIGITGLVLCLSLAVLALPGWWYLRHHWVSGDAIVYTRVLRPGLMIYVVRPRAAPRRRRATTTTCPGASSTAPRWAA